jgi:hypothetical protein
MTRLFKLSSIRKGFFLDPKLRLSQRSSLNDPFECLPQASQVASLYDRIFAAFKKQGSDVTGYDTIGAHIRKAGADVLYKYTDLHDRYGIISFCREIDSILIWSHYADNHKGIAIEIEIDKMGLNNSLNHSQFSAKNIKSPQPVIYSKSRSVVDTGETNFSHLFDSFFIKSDEWAYEKEYRIVADLVDSNEVWVEENIWESTIENSDVYENYKKFFDVANRIGNQIKLVVNDNAYKIDNSMTFGDNPDKMRNNILANTYSRLAKHPSSLFFYRFPIECISKIYLGCTITPSAKNDLLEEINQCDYKPEIIQLNRSNDRFELNYTS